MSWLQDSSNSAQDKKYEFSSSILKLNFFWRFNQCNQPKVHERELLLIDASDYLVENK